MDNIKFLGIIPLRLHKKDLLGTLILGIEDKRIWLQEKFWDELRDILEDLEADDLVDCFMKVLNYLDKEKKLDSKRKWKKLTKLFRDKTQKMYSMLWNIFMIL